MNAAYAFMEGELRAWTGFPEVRPDAPYAFVRNVTFQPQRQYENPRAINGQYRHHLIGKRVDVTFQMDYNSASHEIFQLFEGSADIHIAIDHADQFATAGFRCWSGKITNPALLGSDNRMMSQTVQYYANYWSSYRSS